MASKAAATAAKALYAEQAFLPKGPINSGRFNLVREIAIGTGLGLIAGAAWKVRGDERADKEGADGTRGGGARARGRGRDGQRAARAVGSRAPTTTKRNAMPTQNRHRPNNTHKQLDDNAQMYHWEDKRRIATYYKELADKEGQEEAAHNASVAAKMAALREELLKGQQ